MFSTASLPQLSHFHIATLYTQSTETERGLGGHSVPNVLVTKIYKSPTVTGTSDSNVSCVQLVTKELLE